MPTYLELANFMDVPVQALRLARPSEFTCKVDGCLNHAIIGNYRFCAYHNQKWYDHVLSSQLLANLSPH